MGRQTAWGLDALVPGGLKYAQYSRPCSPGRLSRCRFHNRPYNLHQGVHVTRRKICVLFFLSMSDSVFSLCERKSVRGRPRSGDPLDERLRYAT
jgi:hypothetical protein